MAVLLLDSTYEPIRVIGWQRAMMLVFQDKADVVEESDKVVRTTTAEFKMPSVIRQKGKFKKKGEVQFSRINVYTRDAWTCQYCRKKKIAKDLTFDHVVPRYQGGKTTWENIVTACRPCNNSKDNMTPEQAGLKLMKKPVRPKFLPTQVVIRVRRMPENWKPYMTGNSVHWDKDYDDKK